MNSDNFSIDEQLLSIPIYLTAFTHRSYLNESDEVIQSNERLEFLGDSVLSLIMSDHLYHLKPQDAEGELTNLRSYIVKTTSLAKASAKLGLGKYLRLSRGEEVSGGRDNPQLLANTFEALLGAIYLDKGIDSARVFIENHLLPLFEDALVSGPPKDSKSYLQELSQNRYKQSPQYRILKSEGPDHARIFTVGVFIDNNQYGQGQGYSKQVAEEAAATEAISKLEISSES